jgi:SPP1 gp7 family putative phage head morphogenesis protein
MAINPRDILARHQVYLERLKSGYAKDTDGYIQQADVALAEIFQALRVERMSELTRKALTQLQGDIRTTLGPIYQKQGDKLLSDLMELVGHEEMFERQLIGQVAKESGVSIVVKKAKDIWKKLITKPIQATGELLEGFVKDLGSRQIARINKEVLISVSQGRTISQTVQAIRGTKARNYRDGIMISNARDARTIVRTATQHVSQQVREATWEANDDLIDKYQIVATLDGRTSTVCKSLDQTVYKIGQGPTPPLHPNCRTTTVPYFKPSIWDKGATRSSLNGPVDQQLTYYQWLKDQPTAFQNDALGASRAKLFRDGGLSADEFSKLQLDRNFQPLTLDDMRKLNPNAFERAKI